MELINQRAKGIMEGCKERARSAGLRFDDATLEYIVTNRDLLELTPKLMIPTLYDYWVHEVEVLREKGRYELYPNNPYETVINTRPAISFYNDNNPDWMNVMIFYHVLGHIDFFQNNVFFRNTWDYDFTGRALSDKRLIARLRSEKGRWVDYIVEFSRALDNLVGYHAELDQFDKPGALRTKPIIDYYFDVYLQSVKKCSTADYVKEVERYNQCLRDYGQMAEKTFFGEVTLKNPEFDSLFKKHLDSNNKPHFDIFEFLLEHSEFLKKEQNRWIKTVMEVVRQTSLFFQPQIRTKIMNEGWASYWHEKLFLSDDRIKGHEVDFAKTHAGVAAMPRVGLNPYALGLRLFYHIEKMGDTGRYSMDYMRLLDSRTRERYDTGALNGQDFIFDVRKQLCDSLFVDTFVNQDFVNTYKLFVAGKRLNRQRMVWEYYVKSRRAEDYRAMIHDSLYHPPHITIDQTKNSGNKLYLVHHFEEKPLVREYIANTMMGIEYLWGGPVQLETSEVVSVSPGGQARNGPAPAHERDEDNLKIEWRRVLYTMKDRKLSKRSL